MILARKTPTPCSGITSGSPFLAACAIKRGWYLGKSQLSASRPAHVLRAAVVSKTAIRLPPAPAPVRRTPTAPAPARQKGDIRACGLEQPQHRRPTLA